MATITLLEYKGPRSVQLSAEQAAAFELEARRVRGNWLSRLLNSLFWPRTHTRFVAPDCVIQVRAPGGNYEYELYGAYLLHRVGERPSYRFYMGLLLLEWLYR